MKKEKDDTMFRRRMARMNKAAPDNPNSGESISRKQEEEQPKYVMPDQLGADGFIRTPAAEHLSLDADKPKNVIDKNIGNEVEKESS